MKKIISILLIFVLCLSLCACGKSVEVGTENNEVGGESNEPEPVLDDSDNIDNMDNEDDNIDYESELLQILCEKNVWYGMCEGESQEVQFTFFEDGSLEVYDPGWGTDSYTWKFEKYYKDANDYFAESHLYETNTGFDATRGLYVTNLFVLGYDIEGKILLCVNDYVCYEESRMEVVEITLDNWQEYFEITDYISIWKNDFGEVDSMQYGYCLSLKNEYIGKVTDADVPFEYYFSQPCYADIEYNIETEQIVVGEAYTEEQIKDKKMPVLEMHARDEHSSTNTFSERNIDEGKRYMVMNYEYTGAPLTLTDNVATWCSAFYQNAEIIRIQGSLTIVK